MRNAVRWGCAAIGVLIIGAACTKETSLDSAAGPSVVPSPATVMSVAVSGATSLFQQGQTAQLTATATLSNGLTENRTSSATWSSSASGVVQVSASGLMTAQGEGNATVTAAVGSARGTLNVTVKYGFRTPDPPPGQRLPKPDEYAIVSQVAAQYPNELRNSCQPPDGNGTWDFMNIVVDRLREKDLRWGFNGKLGDPNNPATDEVAYHYGAGAELNSTEVYTFDVVGGRCGPNPGPAWFDISDRPGIWITRGRF